MSSDNYTPKILPLRLLRESRHTVSGQEKAAGGSTRLWAACLWTSESKKDAYLDADHVLAPMEEDSSKKFV